MEETTHEGKNNGLLFAVIAYGIWGILPLYWKALGQVAALDILCYRIIWSCVFMLVYILATRKWSLFISECRSLWQDKKKLLLVISAAVLISANWFTYIFSVNAGKVTEASLGYYMNPLVNVLLALVLLREPLSRTGKIACACALMGVVLLSIQTGTVPLPSLIMAVTFSIYGLIKKGISLSPMTSLTIETLIILPFALGYLLLGSKAGFMSYPLPTNLLLLGAGIITAIPLLLFAKAAKKISYIVLGFVQYFSPTLMLLMALFLFHEPYTRQQFTAFAFIWLGIAIFTYGNAAVFFKERRFAKK